MPPVCRGIALQCSLRAIGFESGFRNSDLVLDSQKLGISRTQLLCNLIPIGNYPKAENFALTRTQGNLGNKNIQDFCFPPRAQALHPYLRVFLDQKAPQFLLGS
jgi:hypothetical protein